MARPLGEATRDAYGKALAQLGRENPHIVVLDGDLSKSTMTKYFAQEFPDRFFNVGIAEANMVGIAAGLAASGKIPFASSFACFVMCKAFDQMRLAVSYSGNNVKIVGTHGGISIGEDGVSQMGHEDIGLALSLPNFVVMVPADGAETRAAVRAAVEHVGPVYIRVGRPKAPIVYENGCPDFQIGKAITLRDGRDVTLIANGLMVAAALDAAEQLQQQGISARVLDMHTVRPLDEEAVERAARETGAIVVAEEHLRYTGLGAQVAMAVARRYPVPMRFIGLYDYAESGAPEALMRKYGLTADDIAREATALVNSRQKVAV
jgi:transketolase